MWIITSFYVKLRNYCFVFRAGGESGYEVRRGKGTRKGKQVIKQVMKAGGSRGPDEPGRHEGMPDANNKHRYPERTQTRQNILYLCI